MASRRGNQSPPNLIYALAEFPRVMQETVQLRFAQRWLQQAPAGDGHAVLVLPGFLGSDQYNRQLIEFLQALGYLASGWGLGNNRGPQPEVVEGLTLLIEQMYERHGKVSIIGHSLGGLYAREMARNFPDLVRQVISLGSPIGEQRQSTTFTARLYRLLNPNTRDANRERIATAPPVPTTAVFTRTDGVVYWQQSIQLNGHQQTENIEVKGSHSGLTVNAAVWWLLAERLAQPENQWRPFKPEGWQKLVYPQRLQSSENFSMA